MGAMSNAGFGGMGLGRGYRRGPGRGMRRHPRWGWGLNRAMAAQTQPVETQADLDMLKVQAESMQQTLDAIQKRIREMENTQ
jgi:hypothetical protein